MCFAELSGVPWAQPVSSCGSLWITNAIDEILSRGDNFFKAPYTINWAESLLADNLACSRLPAREIVVKSRSVKRNAKNARRLGSGERHSFYYVPTILSESRAQATDNLPIVVHYVFLWDEWSNEANKLNYTIVVIICPGNETNKTSELLTEVGKNINTYLYWSHEVKEWI